MGRMMVIDLLLQQGEMIGNIYNSLFCFQFIITVNDRQRCYLNDFNFTEEQDYVHRHVNVLGPIQICQYIVSTQTDRQTMRYRKTFVGMKYLLEFFQQLF
eukprot:TRINITY_DN505_c0_g1_i5.p4 TRINITY_DN505_c0_g1~~TRINITY_DN505_c0_g1_i5.p4  ORF type:complete len:100 (-),score=1.79 TRINITY_DN505_c0_g1_i5:453-752(-)